jgi:methylamine utilization protein MauE
VTFEALAPPFFLLAALLMVSGAVKVHRPSATAQALLDAGMPGSRTAARGLGVLEIGIGLWASVAPAAGGAGALALIYLAFAGFLAFVLRTRPRAGSCGCAGATAVPPSSLHLWLDVVAAGCALAYATSAGPALPRWIAGMGIGAVPAIGGLAVAGWLAFVVVTEVPAAWRSWAVPPEREDHDHDANEHASAEDALASAGIGAGHPSLWPTPTTEGASA